ncbi:MAG: hypothetical protein EHM24_31940 [Acidobacteria bacterium]|nr:MAG: hypothetical protein EHM24_31940 [Acidobacteriota bacterium]
MFLAMVDDWGPLYVEPGGPSYLSGVPGGNHLVTLLPPANCTVETEPQPITVTVGGLARDTVEVTFSATCRTRTGFVRVTAPTSGPSPSSLRYQVEYDHFGYWDYGGTVDILGGLAPNDTILAELPASRESGADPYWYFFRLTGIPANCTLHSTDPPYPDPWFAIEPTDTLELEFPVMCS